jgi:predicted PurR-regulated permease PerM
MEIPTWWLVITAIFAVFGTIAILALIVAVLTLVKKLQELQPKVHAMSERVERISDRVERISETIEDISGRAKGTIDNVAGGATAIMRSLTSFSEKAEAGLTKFAPLLVGVKLASSLFQAVKDRKQTKITAKLPAKIEVEAKP